MASPRSNQPRGTGVLLRKGQGGTRPGQQECLPREAVLVLFWDLPLPSKRAQTSSHHVPAECPCGWLGVRGSGGTK